MEAISEGKMYEFWTGTASDERPPMAGDWWINIDDATEISWQQCKPIGTFGQTNEQNKLQLTTTTDDNVRNLLSFVSAWFHLWFIRIWIRSPTFTRFEFVVNEPSSSYASQMTIDYVCLIQIPEFTANKWTNKQKTDRKWWFIHLRVTRSMRIRKAIRKLLQ